MRLKPQALGLLAILGCLIAFWADADTALIGGVLVAVGLMGAAAILSLHGRPDRRESVVGSWWIWPKNAA
jgi:hypothetical protein